MTDPIEIYMRSGASSTRSVRVPDAVWNKCRALAEELGLTISDVINLFLRGFADGQIPLPEIQLVYKTKDTPNYVPE